MGKIRAGLKFNIGKHGRIWIPLGGGNKRNRSSSAVGKQNAGKASGTPAAIQAEASIGTAIVTGLMSLLLIVGLFFAIVAVGAFVTHKSAGAILGGIISAVIGLAGLYFGVLGLVAFIACIKELKARGAVKTEERASEQLAAEGMEKTNKYSFYLIPEADDMLQQKLRSWKLRGGTIELALRSNDETGDVSFTSAGVYVGRPGTAVASWITQNFKKIKGIYSAAVRGGGHDLNDEPRLFTLSITLDLTEPTVHPKAEADPLPIVRNAFDFDGDRVCVLSKTGKIHTCPPSCGIGDAGLKRYLLDDLDPDKYSLCLKCYKDYF